MTRVRRRSTVDLRIGVFASTVDGLPHVINGNSGKAPAEAGGFTGWTLVGVTKDNVKAEVRPMWTPSRCRLPPP